MFDLAFYSGHNASFTIAKDGKILEVLELERLLNTKNMGLAWYEPKVKNIIDFHKYIIDYFKNKYGATEYQTIICNHSDLKAFTNDYDYIHKLYNTKKVISFGHQEGHAYNSFYQSPFEEAYVLSFDGGGDDGNYNFYKANRKTGIKLIHKDGRSNLGQQYAYVGYHCESLSEEKIELQKMLVYPGKLMGLVGYGKVLDNHIQSFKSYYSGHYWNDDMRLKQFEKIQVPLGLPTGSHKLSGDLEKNIVATSQKAFELVFDEILNEIIPDKKANLVLTGGCALNVLNNTEVSKHRNVFISPNPDDRGLSLGFMLAHLKPQTPFDSTYIGPEVFDKHLLMEYINNYNGYKIRLRNLADMLMFQHKIIGVVRGTMEHGARALGNRSIICHPSAPDMKNILNKKVKGREYYRPFAPVVRLEDVSKYFEWNGESRWMSFCPKVKDEWKGRLQAITHIDGTARVQTVTYEQNPFLYSLLTILEVHHDVGVLLNTSFNVAGKPILNTYRDAISVFENTEMDGLILEDYYIQKNK